MTIYQNLYVETLSSLQGQEIEAQKHQMKSKSHQIAYHNLIEQLEGKGSNVVKDSSQSKINKSKQRCDCLQPNNYLRAKKISQKILKPSTNDNLKAKQKVSTLAGNYENFDFYPYHKAQSAKSRQRHINNSENTHKQSFHGNKSSEKIKNACRQIKIPYVCSHNTSVCNQLFNNSAQQTDCNLMQQTDRIVRLKTQSKGDKSDKPNSLLVSYQYCGQQRQNETQKKVKRPVHAKLKLISSYNNSNTRKKDQQIVQKVQNQEKSQQKSVKYSYKRFLHEVTEKLSQIIKISKQEQFLQHKISYIEFLECLKSLKMIKETYQPYPHDLVSSLWGQFICNRSVSNFILVVSSILKFQCRDLDKNEVINSEDFYLERKFSDMRMLRLQLKGYHYTSPKNEEQSRNYSCRRDVSGFQDPICCNRHSRQDKVGFTFKPSISRRSQQFGNSKSYQHQRLKNNIVNSKQNGIGKGQSDELRHNIQLNTISQYQKGKVLNFFRKQCSNDKGNRRSQILYELAKSKSQQKLSTKTKNDIQYQINKQQCTFNPKISKSNSALINRKKQDYIKGQENSVNRILKGRIQKAAKQLMIEKGLPFNQKTFAKIKKQKYQQLFMKKSNKHHQQSFYYQQRQKKAYTQGLQPEINLDLQMINSFVKQIQTNEKQKNDRTIPKKSGSRTNEANGSTKKFKIKDKQESNRAEPIQTQGAQLNYSFQQDFDQQNQNEPVNRLTNRDIVIVNIFVEEGKPEQLVYHKKHETVRQAAQRFAKKHGLGYKQLEKLAKQLQNIIRKQELSLIKQQSEESVSVEKDLN